MAGHSHWANIKHKKARVDSKRAKVWGKIAKKIMIAAKGGANPADNLSLRYIIDEAKAANMPKDTIEKAVLKGSGELGAENFEEVVYEGYGPSGVAMLVEALTDNRARTAPELRLIFDRNGGNLATTGSVGFQFTKQGLITLDAAGLDEEALMEVAIESGAEDVQSEGYVRIVITPPADFMAVKDAMEAAGFKIEDAQIANVPQNTVALEGDVAERVRRLIDLLEDNDDVQSVSHNAELPEEANA